MTLSEVMYCYETSFDVMWYYVVSCGVKGVMWCYVESCADMLIFLGVMWRYVASCSVIWR